MLVTMVVSSVSPEPPGQLYMKVPVAPGPHTVKRTSRRGGGGLGNLCLHLSIVIFISFILTSSSSFSFMLSVFVSFSSAPFCSYHILSYLIWTPCCANFAFVVLPPLYPPPFLLRVLGHFTRLPPLSPPSELCRLAVSCFLSASSTSSSSSATENGPDPLLHDSLCLTCSRSFQPLLCLFILYFFRLSVKVKLFWFKFSKLAIRWFWTTATIHHHHLKYYLLKF